MPHVLIICAWLGIGLTHAALAQVAAPNARVMADGRTWTLRNLDVTSVESWCYDDDERACVRYGRLYSWAAAGRACEALGTGWRLPTEAEWRGLARAYGGAPIDENRLATEAYDALVTGGRSGFEAVLGGGRFEAGGYSRGDAHGFYWTATEDGSGTASFLNFGKGSRGLYRQTGGQKTHAFAVRCVRD